MFFLLFMRKTALYITLGICSLAAAIFFTFDTSHLYSSGPEHEYYKVLQKWELPDELEEISGMVFIDDQTIACIQDEKGIIFLYSLKDNQIEEEIEFGDNGDYEGLALNGETAYVLRSDGTIFEVANYLHDKKVTKYETSLTARQNIEGLCLDKNNNRLLLAVKSQGKEDRQHKGVYTFDLASKQLNPRPFFNIDMKDPIFEDVKTNQLIKKIRPSEIGVNPGTGELYIIDGEQPKILITTPEGKSKQLYLLDKKKFPQPEGLTFSPSGRLYISNEGHGEPATILMVQLEPKPEKKPQHKEKK